MSKCGTCKKTNCCCASNGSQALLNQMAELQDTINALSTALKPFVEGHPILPLENVDDIACFDTTTGLGSDTWDGWAICDGKIHKKSSGTGNIKVPNIIDRVLVQSGGNYVVGDIQGADSITLTVGQLPAHDHAINDPGHHHEIDDPGHTHGVVDPTHTHVISGGSHTHTINDHTHPLNPSVFSVDENSGTGPFAPAVGALVTGTNYGGLVTGGSGVLTTNATAPTMTAAASPTGVSTQSAFTGITTEDEETDITMDTTGDGDDIDIRNQSYAVLFAMKL